MRFSRRQVAFVSYASRVALSAILSLLLAAGPDWAALPAAMPVPAVLVTLTAYTLPSQGQAGASVIYVTGTGYPAGTIPASNVTVSFATSCGGTLVASATASAFQLLYGTTERAQVLIPATLTANTYFVSVSGTTSSGTAFASSNCSQVQVTSSGVGPAAKLAFTTQPTNGSAGTAIAPVVVKVEDANGNVVTGSNASITITSTAAGGTTTVAAVNGVATFNNLVFTTAGSYALTAASTGLTNATSNAFTISAGTASKLVFSTQPVNGVAGSLSGTVVVQVQDANGNVVTGSSASISITSTPAGVGGTTTVAAVNGVATFSNLVFTATGSYTLTAASTGLPSATSTPFTISAGVAATQVFSTQPGNGTAGSPLGNVVVQVQDANGNLATGSSVSITFTSTPGGVGGTTTAVAVNGVATFSNLVFTAAGSYTLTAASAGLASATSTPFTISALSPASLVFTTQPPLQVQTGQVFVPATQVTVEDATGTVVSGYNGPVTITIGSNPGGAILSGTLTQNAVNGIASFADLSLNTAGNGYTLMANAVGLTATSSPFNVTLSPAALAACVPAGSLSVLVKGNSVTAYVPNGSWFNNMNTNVQVVPVEGSGSPQTINTPHAVNSCATNSVTGQTVCTANNTDVYLISGSTLTASLTSSSNSTASFSGGSCNNCGVAIDPLNNRAIISIGASNPNANATSALQFLDLTSNTLATPIPLGPSLPVSEDIAIDLQRKMIMSADEAGVYEILQYGPTTSLFDNHVAASPNPDLDASAVDCIALASLEFTTKIFLADLTQASFTSGSPVGSWSGPSQFQDLPELSAPGASNGTDAIVVVPGQHLGIVTGEFGGNLFAVFQLPATAGTGTPALTDYVTANFPPDPTGAAWQTRIPSQLM